MTVCEHLDAATADGSPLNRMLIAGYYDGPTEGVIECRDCGQTYAFRMLAWDEHQDVRIFAVVPLAERFSEIRGAYPGLAETDKDVLVIPPPTHGEQSTIELMLGRPASYVVAALDLQKGIIAKRVCRDEPDEDQDWFAWLGL